MDWKTWGLSALLLGSCSLNAEGKTFYTYQKKEIAMPLTTGIPFTLEGLVAFDETYDTLLKNRLNDEVPLQRVRAYLYSATYDFASLLDDLGIKGSDDLAALRQQVARLFFPDLTPINYQDPVAKEIGGLIFSTYETRFLAEEKRLAPSKIKEGQGFWRPKTKPIGLYFASATPWYLESAKEIPCPPIPPRDNPFWQGELQQLKSAMKNIDENRKNQILFWAQDGDWQIFLRDGALKAKSTPLDYLYARAVLERTLQDALIVAFYEKYSFGAKRPDERFKEIVTVVPTPAQPSYPSGHSTMAGAAEKILTTLFPDSTPRFRALAAEAGWSRITAGVHFPIDHEEGLRLGHLIGQKALREELD